MFKRQHSTEYERTQLVVALAMGEMIPWLKRAGFSVERIAAFERNASHHEVAALYRTFSMLKGL